MLADPKWGTFSSEVSPEKVIIERKLGAFLHNSWNPIFAGKFEFQGGHASLVGHFRIHWLVLIFMVVFLAFPLYDILTVLPEPDPKPGLQPGWKAAQIKWNLEFFGLGLLIVLAGWIFGLPNAKRIVEAINESRRGT